MKNSTYPMFIGGLTFGAFMWHGVHGNTFWTIWFLGVTAVCVVGWYLLRRREIPEEVEEASRAQPTVIPPVRTRYQATYEPTWDARRGRATATSGTTTFGDVLTNVAAGTQAFAEIVAEGAVNAAANATNAYQADPKYWRGAICAGIAILSAVGGMLGWWSTWKGFHLAGVLALLSTGFFMQKYDKVDEFLGFISRNKAAIWFGASVLGFVVTPVHKNWPMGMLLAGFFLSGVAALITLLDKWKEVGEFFGTWLFAKGKVSLLIWVAIAIAGLLAFISPALLFNRVVTVVMAQAMVFYAVAIVVLVVVGIGAAWRKL